ncbi:MAG: hypothetical protein H0U86_02895 [Chloroflexi bacterium]|nr:hypothetical protein [Chloroflexota bacterium]
MQSNLDVRVVLSLIEERESRLRRTSLPVHEREYAGDRRPVRRWIGRRMVRFGARLAGEPTMRQVRAR